MAEAEAKSFVPQVNKLVGRIEARYWKVIFRRTQVLADGKDIDAARPEIPEYLDQLFARFAQADHHAALGYLAGREFLGIFQQG
jgi:hypothetical protein